MKPSEIRTFIKRKYARDGIDYVLLVGDEAHLPWKVVTIYGYQNTQGQEIPSDQYYGCLDGDFKYPNFDWACEVAVGRVGVRNKNELAAWVAKSLRLQEISKDSERRLGVVNFGEKLDDITLGKWCMEYLVDGRESEPSTIGFPQQTKFTRLYDDFDLEISGDEFLETMNGGDYHIVNHMGHGWTIWVMRLMAERIPEFRFRPSFFYSQACLPNEPGTDNWTIQAVRFPEYGPAAMISNTRSGWYEPGGNGMEGASSVLHRNFWNMRFAYGVKQVGKMNHKAKDVMIGVSNAYLRIYVALESALIGDPELDLGI